MSTGAGGSEDSDLAKATELALAMETALGFSTETPLLYRYAEERFSLLTYNPRLAGRVNARLDDAYEQARAIIQCHHDSLLVLADALLMHETLEGDELVRLIEPLRRVMAAQNRRLR